MHYLIDGHNLIAHIPEIDLEDPNDEVKLVLLLRSWAAAGRKRAATLFFDGGLPGGRQPEMSGGGIDVVFAPAGKPADHLLIRRIRQVRNPREYTLVSSDRQIVQVARERQMPVQGGKAFAGRLAKERQQRRAASRPAAGEDPEISAAEVQEWLALFGPEPELPQRAAKRPAQKQEAAPAVEKRPAGELKTEGELSAEDVAAWLELFGGEATKPEKEKPKQTRKQKDRGAIRDEQKESALSDEDLAAWRAWFGEE